MPLQTKSNAFDPSKDLNETLMQQLGPYQEGVQKALKKMGEQQAIEALQNGIPYQHIEQQAGLVPMQESAEPIRPQQVEQSQQGFSENIQMKPSTSAFNRGGVTIENGNMVYTKPGWFAEAYFPERAKNDVQALLHMAQIQKQQQQKGVYGIDQSGKLTLQGVVPEGSEVRSIQNTTDLSSLPTEIQPAAWSLARKIGGVRGAKDVLPTIVRNLQEGKSIDQIEDSLRYMQQSPEYQPVRDAAQSILVNKTESQRNLAQDALDDYIQKGDTEGARSYLKRMSLANATADQQNQFVGKERTLDFLNEIEQDLSTLEKNGQPTGWIAGNWENILSRVGQVRNPALREVATKLAVNIMNYRRSMTGVQFGMQENKEYYRIFPNINKVATFNTATIKALRQAFTGDLDNFYSLSMGKNNYQKLFPKNASRTHTGNESGTAIGNNQISNAWTKEKEARYQELLRKRGK
jgi:hypothetical protein